MTLTQQLKAQLSELIEIRGYNSGDQFPTEKELCHRFNVSRHTMREAMRDLVQEGYLYRIQGKGTFVSNLKVQVNAGKKMNFAALAKNSGYLPSIEYLTAYSIHAKEIKQIAKKMGIRKQEIWCVEFVRKINDLPLVYTQSYLPKRLFADLDQYVTPFENLDIDFYELLKRQYGLEYIVKGAYSLETVLPEINAMKILCISGSTPVFVLKSVSTDNKQRIIDFRISVSRGDMIKFNNLEFEYENNLV